MITKSMQNMVDSNYVSVTVRVLHTMSKGAFKLLRGKSAFRVKRGLISDPLLTCYRIAENSIGDHCLASKAGTYLGGAQGVRALLLIINS